jgi:uncharacterized membrane protein YphA (DoxX/SURF4 family)
MWGMGERSFPCLPVWGEATEQAGYLHVVLFGGLSVALIGGLYNRNRVFALAVILLVLLLCAVDLNRLQPWAWFYMLVLGIAWAGKTTAPLALRWLLAAVYFWGGVNKLTPYFAEENFQWFCEVFQTTAFLGQYPALGYLVAIFEIVLAVLLIVPQRKAWFGWIYVVFHGLIIISLFKAQWNYVVIPWNAAMAALAVVLLFTPDPVRKFNTPQAVLLFLAGVMPVANLFHYWPHQLSWQLYSNTQPEAVFYSTAPCEKAGDIWREKSFDEGRRFLLDDWSGASLGVPMFYSDHTFGQMARYLCNCIPERDSGRLMILYVNPWDKSAERTTVISCQEVK